MVSKGTHIIIPLVEKLEDLCWEAKVVEQSDKRIKLSVNSPADAIIGRFKLTVVTRTAESDLVNSHDPGLDIVLLFNPWCEGKTCRSMKTCRCRGSA